MGYPTKIVTCCYCGTRAALVLKGKTRHELACSNCGAPLHDLKMLPKARRGETELVDRPQHMSFTQPQKNKPVKKKKTYRKRRKSMFREFIEEAFEFVEDIFD